MLRFFARVRPRSSYEHTTAGARGFHRVATAVSREPNHAVVAEADPDTYDRVYLRSTPMPAIKTTFAIACRGLLCVAISGATSLQAAEPDWKVELTGGPGGDPFEAACPAGSFMVGVNARIGDDLDAVQPLCATPPTILSTGSPQRLTDAPSPPAAGGPGGDPASARCPESAPFVRRLEVWSPVKINTDALQDDGVHGDDGRES